MKNPTRSKAEAPLAPQPTSLSVPDWAPGATLASLGAYGFGAAETVVLAALVTEDPLLLIGRSGTGKTYLLNTLSEALGLEHRHYNASLVSFDDLVGFPYPDDEKASVRFLETPATIWGAESVLVDEISRCRPEHQNRLFSLVHERRVQGLPLPRLRYRWAAMNPSSLEEGGDYAGSQPLDRALADRFAFVVEVGDWADLTNEERLAVADPSGEGLPAPHDTGLRAKVQAWRAEFLRLLPLCPPKIRRYAEAATTALNDAGVRVSPRRARMVARNLLGAYVVAGAVEKAVFERVLRSSLPNAAWGERLAPERAKAAHQVAWAASELSGAEAWIHSFHSQRRLLGKLQTLLASCPDPDAGTIAVCQCLATEPRARAAAFAFALHPAALAGRLPVGAEAVADLGRLAKELLAIDAEVSWRERINLKGTRPPQFDELMPIVDRLSGGRSERARQLFLWAVAGGVALERPVELEAEMEACVEELRQEEM